MQFMAVVRRRTESFTDEQFAEVLGPEAERIRELYRDGIVRAIYSRGDVLGAVLLLEAPDEATAHGALATVPLNALGMLEIQQFIPLKPYRGFAPS